MKHVAINMEGITICALVIPVQKHDDDRHDISIFLTTAQNQDFVDN